MFYEGFRVFLLETLQGLLFSQSRRDFCVLLPLTLRSVIHKTPCTSETKTSFSQIKNNKIKQNIAGLCIEICIPHN